MTDPRDGIAAKSRAARELVAASLQRDSIGFEQWAALVEEFGQQYQTAGIAMLCSVAASAALNWADKTGRPPSELLDQLHEHSFSIPLPDGKIYANCVDLVREVMREPRDKAKLDAAANACGADGPRAVGNAAMLAAGAFIPMGQVRGLAPLEALQGIALIEERSLQQRGEQ